MEELEDSHTPGRGGNDIPKERDVEISDEKFVSGEKQLERKTPDTS